MNDCDAEETAAENAEPQDQAPDEHSLDQADPSQEDVGEQVAPAEMEFKEETIGPESEGSLEKRPGKDIEEPSAAAADPGQNNVDEAPPDETEVKEEAIEPESEEPVEEATPVHIEDKPTGPPKISSDEPASVAVPNAVPHQISTESPEETSVERDVVATQGTLDQEAKAPDDKDEHPPEQEIDSPTETTPEIARHDENKATTAEAKSYAEIPEVEPVEPVEPVAEETVPPTVDDNHSSEEPEAVAMQQDVDENKDAAKSEGRHDPTEQELGEPAEKTPEIKTQDKEEDQGRQQHAEPVADFDISSEETMPTIVDETYSPEEPRDDDEYVVISQDEAPMEYAEEYPPIQVSHSIKYMR